MFAARIELRRRTSRNFRFRKTEHKGTLTFREISDREIGENLDDSMKDEGIEVDAEDFADALEDVNFRRKQETAQII